MLRCAIVFFLGIAPIYALANPVLITVDGRNGSASVSLQPGTYQINVASGAWNAWGGQTGFDPNLGETLGWLTSTTLIGAPGRYETPGAAVAATPTEFRSSDVPFTLTAAITDPVPDDNVGAVNIQIKRLNDNPLEQLPEDRINDSLNTLTLIAEALGNSVSEIAQLVSNYVSSSNLPEFIDSLFEPVGSTVSSAISRLAGALTSIGIGSLTNAQPDLLDDAARAFGDARRSPNNPGPWVNRDSQRILDQIVDDINNQASPRQPVSGNGGRSNFDEAVQGGRSDVYDPLISESFVYEKGLSDPNFLSILLPYYGTLYDGGYIIETWGLDGWEFFADASGFEEVFFGETGVDRFRVSGIDLDANPGLIGQQWLSSLRFVDDGRFTGSINAQAVDVPAPATLGLMLLSLFSLKLHRRTCTYRSLRGQSLRGGGSPQ